MDRDSQEEREEAVVLWSQPPLGLEQPQARAHQGSLFTEPSFREMCLWYEESVLEPCVNITPGTRDSRRSYIAQALAWLAQEEITHPDTSDWTRYKNWRRSAACPNHISGGTFDTHRKVLGGVYEHGRRVPKRGWGGGSIPNPLHFTQLRPEPVRRKVPRCMAAPYVTYPLLQAQMPDPSWKALISVLRWMGLRIQEALALPLPGSPADGGRNILDLEHGVLHVRKQRDTERKDVQELKTEFSERSLKLPPEPKKLILEALQWRRHNDANPTREWKRKRGYCWENYLFPFWRDQLEAVMDIHRKVSPEDFPEWERGEKGAACWHVYRHTFATCLMREAKGTGKVTVEDLHKLLGHTDLRSTQGYYRALGLDVVEGDAMDEVWAAQEEKQRQAIEERDGKGLKLVKLREAK